MTLSEERGVRRLKIPMNEHRLAHRALGGVQSGIYTHVLDVAYRVALDKDV